MYGDTQVRWIAVLGSVFQYLPIFMETHRNIWFTATREENCQIGGGGALHENLVCRTD